MSRWKLNGGDYVLDLLNINNIDAKKFQLEKKDKSMEKAIGNRSAMIGERN